MPKVQIIIPAINLWKKYTKPCIDSIKTKYDHRILLIDNASEDETIVEAGKLVSSKFCHQRNEDRWGCSQSWNFGIRDAFQRGYDYVLVLNNDVLLHPKAIDMLVARFEQAKMRSVAVKVDAAKHAGFLGEVTPKDAEMTERRLEFSQLAMVTMVNERAHCPYPEFIFTKSIEGREVNEEQEHPDFSAYMLSKESYEKIGAFDEMFAPAYFEDNDYHRRVNLAGMKAISVPSAIYYHYGSRTRMESGTLNLTNENFEKNRQYYIQKWGGIPGQEKFDQPFNKLKDNK
jgi:GT2 family glycosyltransferase